MARNDINANLANTNVASSLTVSYTAQSGSVTNVTGTNPMTSGTTFNVYCTAQGNGSNLYIYITDGTNVWAALFRTPPNAENYFCYAYFGWPKAFSDTLNWLNGDTTDYPPGQPVTFEPPGSSSSSVAVTVSISTDSDPATAEFSFAAMPS